jgi:hypothetical protein
MVATVLLSIFVTLAPSGAIVDDGQQGQQGRQGQQGQTQQGQQGQVQQGQAQQGQRGQQGQGGARGQFQRITPGQSNLAITVSAPIYSSDGGQTRRTGADLKSSALQYKLSPARGTAADASNLQQQWTLRPGARGLTSPSDHVVATEGATTLFIGNGPTFCDAKASPDTNDRLLNGWRVEVKPQSREAGTATVLVTWQRIRSGDQGANGPGGSVTLTLQAGDRIPLDYIVAGASAAGDCKAVGMGLEVRAEIGRGSAAAATPMPALVESEVWLVHTLPDGKEQSQKQVVRARPGEGADYYFEDVTIPSANGNVNVRVSGNVTVRPEGDGTFDTTVAIEGALFSGTSRLGGGYASSALIQKPNDVISFQMPAIGSAGAGRRGGAGTRMGPITTVDSRGRGITSMRPAAQPVDPQLVDLLSHGFSLRVKTKVIQ